MLFVTLGVISPTQHMSTQGSHTAHVDLSLFFFSHHCNLASFSWNVFAALERQWGCGEIVSHAITVATRATMPASLAKLYELHTKC
jgi:hypothetical protein